MNIGMLWFDNDPKSDLSVKIERAAVYYREKYGQSPNLCFVHPTMVGDGGNNNGENNKNTGTKEDKKRGIEVRTTRSVLPNHFWIGVNSKTNQTIR